ncbi:AAA-like domain-containing protein [Aetokthonos hydrillicola Thurmond2011]|jgi:hypothetical protein|uniref:AAA-like domain-containing protein n=1 Tax=Aetokthonos hydrillicola Thurmond2011 TaxID=2712845 RepID=A0AAP5IH00_9CYAN|nr:AAA-like domain-containing protein [Aetokthonos hydrillicola]MBO3464134.1 serine/threonine protein kinase [Aetokthonos hydrillicola CCALA 1050]MBW4585731.1 AAA-like domain-containing protein [Aetokthonos hydrillicola CCALA 1050]MDR9899235.1 AAA-like domain-containing protein [Aetokthonos hydrillicola Thurmond2011]
MNFDSLLEIINSNLVKTQNRPLNYTEMLILRGIWQYQTYNQIAEEGGYSPGYLTNVVAPELCRRLSQLMGKRVTKKNCRVLLVEYYTNERLINETMRIKRSPESSSSSALIEDIALRFPSGSVPLHSRFYIEQSVVESQVYEEITKPGALMYIKSPREMGKTSLLLRILDYSNRRGYRTVSLSMEQIDQVILNNVNRFLRWLCANVTLELGLEPRLDEYWDEDIGSKVSCTLYFQNYLAKKIDSPLILALDEVNEIFQYPEVAKDFFGLLRSWHEQAKVEILWQKLRFIVVYSTELSIPFQLHQSPFNVGIPIHLKSFTENEIQQLAIRYGLDWKNGKEARQMMAMLGGHPALVHIGIYYLSQKKITLTQLLDSEFASSEIYSHYLERHWITLQAQPELAIALDKVMNSTQPVLLAPIEAYKLNSMGLINLHHDQATPYCRLYQLYFQSKLFYLRKQRSSQLDTQAYTANG